jgi:probable phosphoglycerate mutase
MKSVRASIASGTAGPPRATVLLIRHAETDAMRHTLCGRLPHVPLNAAGVRQAAQLAASLAGFPLEAVYTSPLERARETAGALAAQLDVAVHVDDDLVEINFGEWTGLTFDALATRRDWHSYNTARAGAVIPGGEAPAASADRVRRALRTLQRRHGGAVIGVVTHAELIRYAILRARGVPLDRWMEIDVPPASVTILDA